VTHPTTPHPNAELLQRAFAAFGRDPLVVARSLADDIVWRVPGTNAMSGEYRGRDATLQFLRQTLVLTGGTYRTELQYVVADDERAVAVYRARGEREGRTLDNEQALFCRVRDGRIADVTAVPLDFAAFEAFWR
jgi:ketosteroid isomerase-like protein